MAWRGWLLKLLFPIIIDYTFWMIERTTWTNAVDWNRKYSLQSFNLIHWIMNIEHLQLIKLRISWRNYMTCIFGVNCLTLLSLNKENEVKCEMKRESNTSKFANTSNLPCTTNLSIEVHCARWFILFICCSCK